MTFLDEIETRWCANDPRALQHFRQHPATEDFHSRWNLEIYFQVRRHLKCEHVVVCIFKNTIVGLFSRNCPRVVTGSRAQTDTD